jgi:hypothetical protein
MTLNITVTAYFSSPELYKHMTKSEWTGDYPSWSDIGKKVEAQNEAGVSVVGFLEAEEQTADDDEWPLFRIRLGDGNVVSFYDYEERWRVLNS